MGLKVTGARVFDGVRLTDGPVTVTQGRFGGAGGAEVVLDGGILMPGFVDLQVNGGDGVMFNDAPTAETLGRMAQAHARLGATTILPTLITAPREVVAQAIEAVASADIPGIAGLHLEGPHLALSRKGAHTAAYVRPMDLEDLAMLCDAAQRLPVLKVTVAPEVVTPDQIAALVQAGALVSLGHSDCTGAQALAAQAAGATCVTHLFNAMSQMGGRTPGLVGAALATPALRAGVIADLIHVDALSLKAALAAKPEGLFAVSDAMAVAGSDARAFHLDGRRVARHEGRLTLDDGTLAGADLDLATAVRNLLSIGVPEARALHMVTGAPGAVIGRGGRLDAGAPADFVWLDETYQLRRVWRAGQEITI
ncbi:N-acetylglucosamine-6-phosphate deacetylase [Tropicibacter naphthalenivorans]|uniref:N-acetylglucosamine-6-phosphate deacetylase n=1 Tax=Tropicibacter naphthalenivorans TaxID=441103 RepID=A0A0P1GS94_9RHOB|nr:N-acetylglucosamine-6-phosphate deacetylase [Tropicibacter naphthalenivorans]CUH78541.1 N-acetylglucosamine-6-phosphate deacetylase [Tropicibacter naphthalenivorans]SMC80879.1 N-acetylglucosamine 6-phosphate deacetylase [Tropicibacter naphthalenivorans]